MKLLGLILLPLILSVSLPTFAKNESLVAEIAEKAKAAESDSLVIFENGQTVYEDFFGKRDQLRNVQSVTKSITGLAIGILLDDGKIESLDTPMSKWFPEWSSDPVKSKITLKMVMSHTSGISDTSVDNFFGNPDLIAVASKVSPVVEPGSRFEYSNVAVTLLQKVVSEASGKSTEEFVKDRIFTPLEITEFFWKKDQAGHEVTSGGLSLRTTDLVKIGKIILGQGLVDGKRIISEATLKTLLTKSQTFKSYGLLWWLTRPFGSTDPMNYQLFRAEGYGGQYLTVYPAKGLIAVRTKDPSTLSDDAAQNTKQQFNEFRDLISKWE